VQVADMRVSNIDAVASNGPPDDFNNQPTQFGNWGRGAQPPQGEPPATVQRPGPGAEAPPGDEWPPFADPLDESEPTPWYRRPAALIGWIAAVLILLGLIVYGVLELIQGGQGSSTPSTSTTPSITTSTSTTPPPTTTTTTEPPTSSAVEPPAPQPTWTPSRQPTRQPTQQPPTHRHHLPSLPPEITIPDGPVITLPPGLS
jgi:hypothetical protein